MRGDKTERKKARVSGWEVKGKVNGGRVTERKAQAGGSWRESTPTATDDEWCGTLRVRLATRA